MRTAYGVLASVTGIFCNLFLFGLKWCIGFFLHSISIMADAFNNLSDAGSSIVGLIGVKLAGKPADEEDAVHTLQKLQDNTHQVYTGVTVLEKKQGQ